MFRCGSEAQTRKLSVKPIDSTDKGDNLSKKTELETPDWYDFELSLGSDRSLKVFGSIAQKLPPNGISDQYAFFQENTCSQKIIAMIWPFLGQFALFLQFKAKDEMFDDFRVENLDESCKIQISSHQSFPRA